MTDDTHGALKAIIFDCFGVLTTDGWLPFKRKYFGHNADLLAQATDLNIQVGAGLADYDEFIGRVSKLAGVDTEQARTAIENNVADDRLFEYIAASLKPHYKIGFLSNVGGNWLNKLFEPHQVALFDAVSLSCDTGFVKPDERAYQTIADALGVQPEKCIFIDDQDRNCSAARDAGMQAILYTNFERLKPELEAMLGSSSRY